MARDLRRLPIAALLVALSFGARQDVTAQAPAPADSVEAALLTLVLARHPELTLRRAALVTAEARLRAAGPLDAPSLGAEIEDIPDGLNLADAGQVRVMLEREFLTGPSRSADKAVARTDRDFALADLALSQRRLAAVLHRDLAIWRGWRAVASRLAGEDSLLQQAESALQARFSAGGARYVDVLRLRTERLRVHSERAEALRAAQEGRRRLEGMIAHDDSAAGADILGALAGQAQAPWAISALPLPPDVDSLMTSLDAPRRGDLLLAAAGARADVVTASRRARLIGGIGVQRFGDAEGGFSVGPSLRASISLPFAVRGSNRTLTEAANLTVAQASAQRTAALSRLRTALLLARDRYAAALERLQVYDTALLIGAREEREAALGAYRSGELSLIELLDFERALSRAETDRLRAAIDAHISYAQLFTAADPFASSDEFSALEVGND